MDKEQIKTFIDFRGFVFVGKMGVPISDDSIEVLKAVLMARDISNKPPSHHKVDSETVIFTFDEHASFDAPAFFERANIISNMNINGRSVCKVFTIKEYVESLG